MGISFYLFFQTSKDFLKKNLNLSQKISHFGFAILILSILLNGLLSKEFSSNMKLGDERKFDNKIMQFKNLETKNYSNFKSLIGINLPNELIVIIAKFASKDFDNNVAKKVNIDCWKSRMHNIIP